MQFAYQQASEIRVRGRRARELMGLAVLRLNATTSFAAKTQEMQRLRRATEVKANLGIGRHHILIAQLAFRCLP